MKALRRTQTLSGIEVEVKLYNLTLEMEQFKRLKLYCKKQRTPVTVFLRSLIQKGMDNNATVQNAVSLEDGRRLMDWKPEV